MDKILVVCFLGTHPANLEHVIYRHIKQQTGAMCWNWKISSDMRE